MVSWGTARTRTNASNAGVEYERRHQTCFILIWSVQASITIYLHFSRQKRCRCDEVPAR